MTICAIRLRVGAGPGSPALLDQHLPVSWKLAHPYRFIAHNGEINTVRGNVNWMNARRRTMESDLLGADLDKMWPLIPHGQSDTACLDNALELLWRAAIRWRTR
jgi:glutamate synthase domain-containing protein 1